VSGFRSYEAETRFCWEDRSLVGIVGPIGSGKSSILDAIAFALYNQTPRSGTRTGSLINQRRDVAQVSLTFDVDGATYKAVRSLRRTGASAHALYRIEEGEEVGIADRAAAMLETVETLLGLDFQAFQRSVLLAQNQFAAFLEAGGSERNTVLKGVFGFDRLDTMRSLAKDRLGELQQQLAGLDALRSSGRADADDLATKRSELMVLEDRVSALEELRKPFTEAKETIADLERRLAEADAELERLDALADRIPDRGQSEELLAGAGTAAAAVEAAEVALAVTTTAKESAVSALEELLEPIGGRAGMDRASDLVAAWRTAVERHTTAIASAERARTRLDEIEGRSKGSLEAVESARAAARAAEQVEQEAVAAVEAAETALQDARQAHRAHAVRVDLVSGQPCPVCEQTVATIPEEGPPASIETAEAALGSARTRRSDAAVASREASETVARLETEAKSGESAVAGAREELRTATEEADRLGAGADSAAAAVAEVLGAGDPAALLEAVRERTADAERAVAKANAAEASARSALDEARSGARTGDAALSRLRSNLAALGGALGSDIGIGEDAEALRSALHALRTEWIERRAAAADGVERPKEALVAARAAESELREAAGLGAEDELVDVVAAAVAGRSAKEAEVALLEKRIADLETLAANESDIVEAASRLERIHADLSPGRFLDYVLDERRRVLGDLASEHFEVLSAGRYRFDDSGDFHVVDLTAADAIRAPASLSGGETFLASLALALALAEIVSREGGRLDAFFLDEGFGSLDPEHLDLAMSGIERLVTSGPDRLVVVVSHVPALNERIEDLIRLDRDVVTGDTRVVAGSGCA
jgi:exonuclease SbcC